MGEDLLKTEVSLCIEVSGGGSKNTCNSELLTPAPLSAPRCVSSATKGGKSLERKTGGTNLWRNEIESSVEDQGILSLYIYENVQNPGKTIQCHEGTFIICNH